jgi:hypothetical protein
MIPNQPNLFPFDQNLFSNQTLINTTQIQINTIQISTFMIFYFLERININMIFFIFLFHTFVRNLSEGILTVI